MPSAFIPAALGYPAMPLARQLVHQRCVHPGPLVLRTAPFKYPTPATDRDRTVSRRSEPSSRTALMGEQPNPWDRIQPQDAMSRHRVAKPVSYTQRGVGLTISLGGLHTTYPGIHLSYNEAMAALQYMAVVGAQEIICYHDIPRQRSTGYTYPMDKEQQLINCIQTGNADGAKEILSGILHGYYGDGSISPTLQKCLTCDLVCTLMKSLSELGDLFDQNYRCV